MKYLLLSFFALNLVGCYGELKLQQDDLEMLEYYSVSNRRNSITSSAFAQFPVEENDSLIVLPGWWIVEGDSMNREEVFEFRLPKTKDNPQIFEKNCGVYLLDKRTIKVNNAEFVIHKYADRSCAIDGSGIPIIIGIALPIDIIGTAKSWPPEASGVIPSNSFANPIFK